ncbi:MAG: glutamate--tRNA ligase [Chloroflexi bacterium]|nr:glutamate--tRNA ligase [Chloroflexota bacterium]
MEMTGFEGARVRVRLAPSPTGFVHIGNVLVALVDAAIARKYGGTFVIRIEDTDQKRFFEGAEQLIYDSLAWLGIEWHEGPDRGGPFAPYRQSERLPRYHGVAEQLVDQGDAYRCWCSPERLDGMRKAQQAHRLPPKYDRMCLGKSETERQAFGGYTERSVIRLRMPDTGHTTFSDPIRGEMSFENALLDDRVLLKSDGFPTYNLAVVVDDHDMKITHAIRGEEWLPSTPAHLRVYVALGWKPPVIAHTPLLLNADRGKISKRKHPWANIGWFQDQGFLPEAVLNYLGNLIAFVPDTENPQHGVARELFGFSEISEHFELGSIGPSGKVVDLDRLDWLNGQYIRRMTLDELARRVGPFMIAAGLDIGNPIFMGALALEQERLKRLSEAPAVLSIFFKEEVYPAEMLVPKGVAPDDARRMLDGAISVCESVAASGDWSAGSLEVPFRDLAISLDLTTGKQRGQLFGVVRVASTGRTATPPLFDTMAVLGGDTVVRRLAHARVLLAGLGA